MVGFNGILSMQIVGYIYIMPETDYSLLVRPMACIKEIICLG